jgi:hypothetical protein
MTRETQKSDELRTVNTILAALGVRPDQSPESGEAPDFIVQLSGRRIGVEVTMYNSGDVVDGRYPLRAVESEWDKLKEASDGFRIARPELRDIKVGLMFQGVAPPQKHHAKFMQEIADFVEVHRHELRSEDTNYYPENFSSAPLMREYLQALHVRVCEFATWYSSLIAGFVATAATSTIADTVAAKSALKFEPVDELWLAIQCSRRISETMLPLPGADGAADFENVPSLEDYQFSRVFVVTWTGVYQWKANDSWRKLEGPFDQQFPTEIKRRARLPPC